MIVPRCYKI